MTDTPKTYTSAELALTAENCPPFIMSTECRTEFNRVLDEVTRGLALRPIHDIVIVRPAVVNDTTDGGIVIPQKSILKTCEGTVAAVGPGKRSVKSGVFTPTEVVPGDKVLFEASHGVRVNYQGERLLVMREPDIIGVLAEFQGNVYDPTPHYELPEIQVRPAAASAV